MRFFIYTMALGFAFSAQAAANIELRAVSSQAQAGNPSGYAVDGKTSTRWSDDGNPAILDLDAGGVLNLAQLDIQFYKGKDRSTEFSIQISTDGALYTTVVARKMSALAEKESIAINATARFIRILGYGNNGVVQNRAFTSISEIAVSSNSAPPVVVTPTAPTTPTAPATPVGHADGSRGWLPIK